MKSNPTNEQIQAAYYTNSRPEMSSFVPAECKIIFEIGCGEGKFGVQLKNNRQVIVWGVECDEHASQQANLLLDRVFTGRFEYVYQELPKYYFDCIVFNDVLEHFTDPGKVLISCLSLLRPNGFIVSSVPNVRYIGNLYELLIKKDWEYKKGGILDETHYRFYTKKSLRRMFKSCGYRMIRLEGINPTSSLKTKFLVWFSLFYLSDIRYLQFAVLVQK